MRKLYSLLGIFALILITAGSANAQSPYCSVSSQWNYPGITRVSTTGANSNIANFSSSSSGYRNYTSQTVSANAGSSFNITVTSRWGHDIYIDWNQDVDFSDPGERVAGFPSSSSGTSTRTYTITVPPTAAIGNKRMRVLNGINSSSPLPACGFYNQRGETEDYTLNVTPPPPNDASSELADPTICPGTNDFDVRVTNWGSNNLTSVILTGSFGASTYGPTTFSGLNLSTGQDTVLTLGTYTAVSGNSYAISTTSSSPSGQTDGNTANDTYNGTLTPALKGTYTIGGTTPDYATFASAWTDLLASGVCDSTIFNVRSGSYNEQLYLRSVDGADLVNAPIIFQSDPANTTAPRMTYTSSYMVRANAAHDIIVDGLDFNPSGSNFRYRVFFERDNEDLIFNNNSFEGYNTTSTSTSYTIFYAYNTNNNNITITNNTINRGSYVVYARGAGSSARQTGWVFDGNTLNNWLRYGVYGIYTNFASISDNTINTSSYNSASNVYGIYISYSDNTVVDNNTVTDNNAVHYAYNIFGNYTNGATYTNNHMVTNAASTSRWASSYNLYLNRSTDLTVENNYAEIYGPSPTSGSTYNYYFYATDRSTINANEANMGASSGNTHYGFYYGLPSGTSTNPLVVSNNMVYQTAVSTNRYYGMYFWSNASYLELIHNAVNLTLGNTQSRAFYSTMNGANSSIRNNVFVNQGPGDAIYMSNSTSIPRDNNCYYSAGARTGYLGGSSFTDLASLQGLSATDDQNSLVYMPDFEANDDLHMFFDKTLDQAGSAAATIVPEDFDGDVRNVVTPDIGLDEYVVPRNSVALVGIDAPVTPICALGGLYDISILNVGTGNLTSFNVDGVVKHLGGGSTPLTTYNYTGNLAPNADAAFNAGNYSTGFVNGDTLVIWVNSPNGVSDSIKIDDTLTVALTEGIRGTFTVGDTTGGNPNGYDYADLSDAQVLLDSVGAICDTVIFEIADGTYANAVNLIELIGTAPDRPVIFRSMSGDPSLVEIRSGASATITVDGGDNYFFEDITVVNSSNGASTFRLQGGTDNIMFSNCVIENSTNNTTAAGSGIYGDNTSQSNVSIMNTTFDGGSHNIYLEGSSNDENENILVEGNMFTNAYRRGIYLNYTNGFEINENDFTSTSTYTSGEGIQIINSRGAMEIAYNTLKTYGVWPLRSVRIQNTSSLSSNYAQIANNEIHVGTGTSGNSFAGFYLSNTSFMDFNHNTVAIEGFSTSSAGVYLNGGGANELRNNIFANFGNGRALEVYSTYALTYSDHNNLYTMGSQIGRFDSQNSNDFSQWQTNTGLDVSSVNVDPLFYSMTDLKVCASDLDGAGTPTSITMDAQGEMRDPSTPDIGADEFTAPSNFSLPNDTTICKGDDLTLSGQLNDGSFAIWNNFQPSATITINAAGTYRVFASNVCGQVIDSITVSENSPATLSNDTHLCATESIMLDPQVPNGVYAWSTGAATQMLNVSARGIYAVEVTDAFGCVTSDTIAVTQSRGVSLPADTSFCAGNTLTLNANVGQGNYFWSPTGATGPVQFVQTSGNYAVNYVDNFGCTSTDNIMVDVVNDPQAQFSYFNQYYSVAFSDMSADATSYLWTFGDGDSSTAANPTHVYPGPSKYRVQLLVTNACGEDLYEDVISIGALPGFEENLEAGQFNVYPNPNSGDFTVSLNAEGGDYTLEVLTLEGKSIFMNEVNDVQPGLNNYEVSLDGLASGVYFVKVTGAENSQVQKINIH